MKTFLKYLWASPVILVGLLLALPFLILRENIRWRNGALIVHVDGRLGKWFAAKGWGGVTIGATIFLWNIYHPAVEHHERIHVRQVMKWGFLFPFLYFASLLKSGYRNNVFEAEAYEETSVWIKNVYHHTK